ncbi:MAG: NnrU family protein [Betaproteobacteria bacterium]|nr:NnrU family protein [Betaproteobacteria bacterium]
MGILVLGLVVFLGMHSLRMVAPSWRTAAVRRIGERRWKGVYALASIIGFALIVWGFVLARERTVTLWASPFLMRFVTATLTALAFILVAAAYVPNTRIRARMGHPMLLGVQLWAIGHLLAIGTAAAAVLFGSFLLWSLADFVSCRRRDREAGTRYPAGFAARDARAAIIGGVAWAIFAFYVHGWLIGVSPFG